MATTTAWEPNLFEASLISFGFLMALELIEILSAPQFNKIEKLFCGINIII